MYAILHVGGAGMSRGPNCCGSASRCCRYNNRCRRCNSAACLEEIRGVNRNEPAVKREHIRTQTCYFWHIGMYNTVVCRISAAERKPACAVFVNADARIKWRRAVFKPRHILDKPAVRREGQTTDLPVGGGNNSHTAAAVREVQIEVRKTVFLNAGNDGRCP